jgi:hypothetical protein
MELCPNLVLGFLFFFFFHDRFLSFHSLPLSLSGSQPPLSLHLTLSLVQDSLVAVRQVPKFHAQFEFHSGPGPFHVLLHSVLQTKNRYVGISKPDFRLMGVMTQDH